MEWFDIPFILDFIMDLCLFPQVLPLSLIFVGMLAFNSITLKYLGIAFYNVGRSLTTVYSVVSKQLFVKTTIT